MAFSVTSMTGMPNLRTLGDREVFWLPGDPGVAFKKNQAYAFNNGVLIEATDSLLGYWHPVTDVTCAAAATAFTKPADLNPAAQTQDTTLVPCTFSGIAGAQIRKGKYANYQDETVVSYTASTRAIAMTTGLTADDDPNGCLLYVYEGPGAGEWNVVEDYDHAGGAANLLLICHRAFSATLTTSSKFIILCEDGSGTANATGMFSRVDLKDTDELDVSDGGSSPAVAGSGDGNFVICPSWEHLGEFGAIGHMPFMNASAIY